MQLINILVDCGMGKMADFMKFFGIKIFVENLKEI